jgi:hypothetical protein
MAYKSLVSEYKRTLRLIPVSVCLTLVISFGQFWIGVGVYSYLGTQEYQKVTDDNRFWSILGKYFLLLLLQQVIFMFGFSGLVMYNNFLFESALTMKLFLLQMVKDDCCTRDELIEIKEVLLWDPVNNDQFLILVERKLLDKAFA